MNRTSVISVIDKHGNTLMPTRNCKKVRMLLELDKAVPICNAPFTIKLKYEIAEPISIQPLHLGIDTGRENMGIAISTDSGDLVYAEELETNNRQIKKALVDRRMHRSSRHHYQRQKKQRQALRKHTEIQNGVSMTLQSKSNPRYKSVKIKYPGMEESIEHKIIRGAEARFNNRKRPAGWLTPSGRQLIQMHMNPIERLRKFFPITDVHIERVSFDFQKLANADISGIDYNHGPLFGYNTYKDFINDEQRGKCIICSKPIEHYHHIVNKAEGGSNTIRNIAGLCLDCHSKVHKSEALKAMLSELKLGTSTEYSISLLNSIMPQLLQTIDKYCKQHGLNFHITTGYETSNNREILHLDKEHYLDAYVISISDRCNIDNIEFNSWTKIIYKSRRYKKRSKNIVHQLNADRIYLGPNKLKLYNRHPSMCQGSDKQSLHDYMEEHFGDDERAKSRFAQTLKVEKYNRAYTELKNPNHQYRGFRIGDTVYMSRAKKKRSWRDRPKGSKDGAYVITGMLTSVRRVKLKNLKGEELITSMKYCKKLETRGCITIHDYNITHYTC